jgi:Membrane protein involved in the export of O-antigen and teichoic acid
MKGSLQEKTATGVFWNFLELTGRQGINVLVTLLLARFLTPGDFGLVAMLSVFFSIANALMDAGFRQALIRKKDATPVDYSTMFYTNLALGLLSYGLLFISSPAIASFYNEPRLILLTRIVGIVVLINSFQFVQVVDLTRRLDFKTQFKVTVPAGIVSGIVAVIMATKGFGVWSLVAQMVISPLLITISLWAINTWRPSFAFSVASFRELFSFGSKLFLSGILDIVFRNVYVIVIGKLFAATVAGWYFFATKVIEIVLGQLSGSIQKATYPALASIQDDDARLKNAYRKVIKATVYIVFPTMTFLAALAEPLFRLLLTPGWLPAVPYLQLLCVSALVYPLHVVNLNVLQVKGRSDLFLYLEILKKGIIVFVILISIRFGIYGLLLGQIATSFLAYIPNSYFSARLINYPAKEQLGDVIPTLGIALLSGAVMFLIGLLPDSEASLLIFLSQVIVGGIFYILLSWVIKLEAQTQLWGLCKSRLTAKRPFKVDSL